MEFKPWPKVPRLNKVFNECIITEKVDGTNASILIQDGEIVRVGSRKRWITPEDDNFGFAKWVKNNNDELLKLGDGHHFGEWYGSSIQRGYGLKERKFTLFNVSRWSDPLVRPNCCECVYEIYRGPYSSEDMDSVQTCINFLSVGSLQVPGYDNPEGLIIFFPIINQMMKWTFDNPEGKWMNE